MRTHQAAPPRVTRWWLLAAALSVVVLGACDPSDRPSASASATGEDHGLRLDVVASYYADIDYLLIETTLRNDGTEVVEVLPSQCGRLAVARLARTVFESEGVAQPGSIGIAKEQAIRRQRFRQAPVTIFPRDQRLPLPPGGDCVRRDPPVELAPGWESKEVYSVYLERAPIVAEVGSANTVIQTDVIFAEGVRTRFSDIYSSFDAEAAFAGQRSRVELSVSDVVVVPPADGAAPSDAQVFDRIIAHEPLREWIAGRGEDSWRLADLNRHVELSPLAPDGVDVTLRLVSTEFEDALVATFDRELDVVELTFPANPTVRYERVAAQPPPASRIVVHPDDAEPWQLHAELSIGEVVLPTGRLVITEGSFLAADTAVLRHRLPPGRYPVTATVAHAPDDEAGTNERVAFVTVHGGGEPARWEPALTEDVAPGSLGPDEVFGFAVDGGTAGLASAEAVGHLTRLFDEDEAAYWASDNAAYERLLAYESTASANPIGEGLNYFLVSTGFGDGFYPTWVGFDAEDKPVQFVAEFGVVRLLFDS